MRLKNTTTAPQSKSGIEHDPGPRGSPQDPHAPPMEADAPLDDPFAETANTESCGASFLV